MGAKKLDWRKTDPTSRGSVADTKKHRFVAARLDNKTALVTFEKDGKGGRMKVADQTFSKESDAKREARRRSKY